MSIKINRLEIENLKRIKAVKVEPNKNGLTIIGGKNNQGKTSVLDSIAWALGGDRYRPSEATRQGSVLPPTLHVVLSNGIVVDRKGKNSDLKVTDPNGKKGGQQLLNEFINQLALDLPQFMESSSSEKAKTLLKIIGVEDQLEELDKAEKETYTRRTEIGRIADQKKKFAEEQTYYPDAPKELVSASDLIQQQQDILARNAQRQQWQRESDAISEAIMKTEDQIEALQKQLADLLERDKAAQKTPKELQMESTEELEANIANVEEINRKIRINLDKDKAETDAQDYADRYNRMSAELDNIRSEKAHLLASAELPLDGLSVEGGELVYMGQKWDCMSGSDQLKISTAIIRKLNPECGFVLMDKLEQMDIDTLNEFGRWIESEGLQAIATRVSIGDECSIIIEDGYAVGETAETTKRNWEEGF